jgi:hypothetical protein
VKPSAQRPRLRRIAIKFCRDIFAGGGGHVRGNPKTARIDCACCYASRIGRGRRRASQYCRRGCLSYCTEFSRAAGEPLVLPIRLGNSAQVLVLACARPTGATSGCAGYIGAGHIGAVKVCAGDQVHRKETPRDQ